jgi:hypothetical protein
MNAGTIVEHDEGPLVDGYAHITYVTSKDTYKGWIWGEFIELYSIDPSESDIIRINNATQDESDAAQNIVYMGRTQFNLCGEFCVLYCADWKEADIEDWLEIWKTKSPSVFSRIFRYGSRPTGIPDLLSMFDTFEGYEGEDVPTSLNDDLMCERSGRALSTPDRWRILLRTRQVIVGCKINRSDGRLAGRGIPHWVVVDRVIPRQKGGAVQIYNPYNNCIEYYQWEQFAESIGSVPFGISVPL